MEAQKLLISDDEIVVNVSTKKTGLWGIIVSIIIFVGVGGLCGLIGYKYSHIFQSNFTTILGILTGFYLGNRLIWQSKKQYMMAFDKKYIVIYDNSYRGRGRVFKIGNIRNWCINPNYRLTPYKHMLAFFTKGAGGCIAFNYTDIKMPVRIGYGLTPSEAEKLLGAIREKGWIPDFQLSDTALEYRKNEKMKYAWWSFLSLFTIGLILIFILNEPYKKESLFVQEGFMIVLALFCFIMAIISYWQNKKYKEKMLNA